MIRALAWLAVWPCLISPALAQSPETVALNLPLRAESAVAGDGADQRNTITLGGVGNAKAVMQINLPLLRRAMVKQTDLLNSALVLNVSSVDGDTTQVSVNVYRMLRPATAQPLKPGVDYAAKPVVTLPLSSAIVKRAIVLDNLAPTLGHYLRGEWKDSGLLVSLSTANSVAPPTVQIWSARNPLLRGALRVTLRSYPKGQLFDNPVKPITGVYSMVKNGHITYGGKRLRLWGVSRNESWSLNLVGRIERMGFNSFRLWGPETMYTEESAKRGEMMSTKLGDGTPIDQYDRFFSTIKTHDMWVVSTALGANMPIAPLLQDGSWLAGGSDWDPWRDAVKEVLRGNHPESACFLYFDERLQRVRKRTARNYLTHLNLYTRRPYGQEECIALFDTCASDEFIPQVLAQGFDRWPAYFRDELRVRWNVWLHARYADDSALVKAWGGLEPGEGLTGDTVQIKTQPAARRDDLQRFLAELVETFNRDLRTYCRTLAPAGRGVSVAPFVFKTQFQASNRERIDDVAAYGYYDHQTTSAVSDPALPDYIPSKPTNQPVIISETNCTRPNPNRAEFPLRMAVVAATRDYDAVFFHVWNEPIWWSREPVHDEQYMVEALPAGFSMAEIQHATDPVVCASLATGSRIFISGLLVPPSASQLTTRGSRLIIDTPTIKVYAGRCAKAYRFRDGITLSAPTTPFVSFALVSVDGKPLTGAKGAVQMRVSAVYDAANTPTSNPSGDAPVRVSRVPFTLTFPYPINARFAGFDFACRQIFDRSLFNTKTIAHDGTEMWVGAIKLMRK